MKLIAIATIIPSQALAFLDSRQEQSFDVSEFREASESSTSFGISLLLIGSFVSFFGRRLFPYIASTIGGLFILNGIIYGSLAFGLVKDNIMLMIALLFALLAGIGGGIMAHKFIRFGILLTCLVSSFCLGYLLYGIAIYFVTLLQHFYGIAGVFGALFLIQVCCFVPNGRALLMFGTSSIGSYMFMRGWSMLFKKYPAEIETW